MQDLTVKIVQADLAWQDPAANREMLAAMLAQGDAADVVLLPEMWSTGFSMQAAALAQAMTGTSVQWMQQQARQHQALVVGSLIIIEGDKYYNRCIAAHPDGQLHHYDKRHLFRLAHEEETYTAGNAKIVIEYKGWRILPQVCYDLRFPVFSRNRIGTPAEYDLLLYMANWPSARGHHWRRLLPARAIENLCYVAAVNRVGTDGKGHTYNGDSAIIDMQGEVIAGLEAEQAGVRTAAISGQALRHYRQKFAFWRDADDYTLL